eukprot:g5819.t1
MARRAGQICSAVPKLPVIADADTGGGGVLNVQRTVRQFIKAGCKGCCIEDQVWPKMSGHLRGKEVISLEEHTSKIYAAKQAIGDEDFFLIARTDVRGTSAKRGLDEAITRANLYMEAGADASFVEAPRSRYELQEIGKRTKGLRVCNMLEGGLTPMKTLSELQELGFHIIVHPLTGVLAAAKALKEVYKSLADHETTRDDLDKMVTLKEFSSMVGLAERLQREERLLGAEKSSEEKLHVRSFEVEHVVGINKNSGTPLVFDERSFAAYLAGSHVVVFNWQSSTQVQHLTWRERNRALSTLNISPDKKTLAAGERGVDPSLLVWNMETISSPTESFQLRGHFNTITAIEFSPNGGYLASLGDVLDSQLIIWDCRNGAPLLKQNIQIEASFTSMSFSSDSQSLFTSTGKTHLTAWNFSQEGSNHRRERSAGLSLSSKPVMPSSEKATDFVDIKTVGSGKSSFIFALSRRGILYKLKRQNGSNTVEKKIDLRVSGVPDYLSLDTGMGWEYSFNEIAVSCANGIVKLIRVKNLAIDAVVPKPLLDQKDVGPDMTPDAKYCAFDQTGSRLAVIYSDSSLVFWDVSDVSNIQPLRTICSHSGPISDMFPMPTPSRDQDNIDWNLPRNMRSPTIQDPQDTDYEFATCSNKGTINLWNLRMRRSAARQMPHLSPTSDCSGRSLNSLKVEVGVRSVFLNPPMTAKSKASVRKGKLIATSVEPKKEARRSVPASTPLSKTKKSAVKKSPAKKDPMKQSRNDKASKPVQKRKGTGLKSTATKNKTISRTPTPVHLSTDLSQSKVMKTPASGWKDSVVAVRNNSGSRLGTLEASGSKLDSVEDPQLTCLRVCPNGLILVVGDDKGQLRILDLTTREIIDCRKIHSSAITTIEFSRPGRDGELLLATGAADGSVNIIDVQNGFQVLLEKQDHEEPVTGISFSPDGTTVVSCAKDRYIYFDSLEEPTYETEDEEDCVPYFSRHCLRESEYKSMHFNSARQTYMVGCDDNLIRVYSTAGQFVHSLRIPEEFGAPIKILQGPVQSMIITCHATNQFCVFEYFSGKLLAIGESHDKLTGAMVINRGKSLLTTSEDGIMVIWKLDDGLIETCRSLPGELAIEKDELGYANDLHHMIQRERQRSTAVVGELYNYPVIRARRTDREFAPGLSNTSISGTCSTFRSHTSSHMSGIGPKTVYPVGEASVPIPLQKKSRECMPSWVHDQGDLRNKMFGFDCEGISPSATRPPKLELPQSYNNTDDENLSIPRKVVRNNPFLQTGFSDHDGLPLDGFSTTHHSQASFFIEEEFSANRRFRSPMASTRLNEFRDSHSSILGGMGLEHSSSLLQYQDDVIDARLPRRSDSTDRPWNRPTGPEPPSSVSCDSDSRQHCTPFGVQPRSSFESEFDIPLHDNHPGEMEERFSRTPSPYGFGPIGPNIYKRVSRTPQLNEEKRDYTRPNSEEHVEKMFGEISSPSSESELKFYTDLEPERHNLYWSPIVWEPEFSEQGEVDSEDEMPLDPICPPVNQPPLLVAKAGGHLKDNPLYSSGSEASDCAFETTKRFSATNSAFSSKSTSLEESFSCDECGQGVSSAQNSRSLNEKLRTSMVDFVSHVESQLYQTLAKIEEGPYHGLDLSDDHMLVTQKKALLNETRQKLLSMFGQLSGNLSS